jgi:hypothetical protein
LSLLLRASSLNAFQDPGQQEPIIDFSDVGPRSLGVMPVTARKALKTGFDIGDKNPTALIRTLTEISGRTIAELEPDMRPGALSGKGFWRRMRA